MKCVVLGGSGFIGVNLCKQLVHHVGHLRVFGRREMLQAELKGFERFRGDINNREDVARAIAGCDLVIHLVNTIPVHIMEEPVIDMQKNVISTLQMLDLCCEQNVKKVIFASSGGSVYGVSTILPTPEDAPTEPLSSYGVSKLTIEKYLAHYRHTRGLDYQVLRISNPYGPDQVNSHHPGVIAAFLRRIFAGQPVEIWGDGSIIRDYIYIDDVTRAIIDSVRYSGHERILNIGSGQGRSLHQVIAEIERILQTRLSICYVGSGASIPANILDVRRANKELPWRPVHSFQEGLAKTIAWFAARSGQSGLLGSSRVAEKAPRNVKLVALR